MGTNLITSLAVVISSMITCGGILIYIGRSLQTLKQFSEDRKIIFELIGKHGEEINRIDKELTRVKTKQDDCEKCP